EALPARLGLKTWCCDREAPGAASAGTFSAAFAALSEQPERAFTGAAIVNTSAPWYVWVLTGSSAPSLPSRDVRVEPVPVGDAIRMMSLDRDYFVSLRARR